MRGNSLVFNYVEPGADFDVFQGMALPSLNDAIRRANEHKTGVRFYGALQDLVLRGNRFELLDVIQIVSAHCFHHGLEGHLPALRMRHAL